MFSQPSAWHCSFQWAMPTENSRSSSYRTGDHWGRVGTAELSGTVPSPSEILPAACLQAELIPSSLPP